MREMFGFIFKYVHGIYKNVPLAVLLLLELNIFVLYANALNHRPCIRYLYVVYSGCTAVYMFHLYAILVAHKFNTPGIIS